MAPSECPARIEPTFVRRIWGVRSLAPLFPEKQRLAEPIGEVWLTGNESRFASGPLAGHTVASAWRAMPPEWAGTQLDTRAAFPLLAKFLFPGDKLSIQVHPDDDYARANEAAAGGVGKTEAWYVISAEPGAAVWVGLQPDVTAESFRKAIAEGTAESCLQRVPVSQGETIFVPARTAHTIGPGMVLCEIQENSDLTYRVFDYNRRYADGTTRPLHLEKALAVIRFDGQAGGRMRPAVIRANGGTVTHFVACRHFMIEKWDLALRTSLRTERERFELWIPISGEGTILWAPSDASKTGAAEFRSGEAWFVPAGLGEWSIDPRERASILRVYVPDLGLHSGYLARCGLSKEEIAQVLRR